MLNSDILLRIFELASESYDFDLGGSNEVIPWSYSHSIQSINLSLVCRDWSLPAQMILFRSILLVGSTTVVLFLRTLSTRKDLARQTHRMIVSLSYGQLYGYNPQFTLDGTILPRKGEDWGQASTSLDLVRAIDRCTSLRHLRIEPLHVHARELLLLALSKKSLLSLIITPQLTGLPDQGTIDSIFEREDLSELFSPTLKHLHVDYHTRNSTSSFSNFKCITLTTLILETNLSSNEYTSLIAAASSSLRVLHFSTSLVRIQPPFTEQIAAWSLLLPRLERLFVSPCPGFLPTILPHFQKLICFSTLTSNSQVNYVFNLPLNLTHFILYDTSTNTDEETWHRLLWCLKALSSKYALSLVTFVDQKSSTPEELFFGRLTVERLPWFTLTDFLNY